MHARMLLRAIERQKSNASGESEQPMALPPPDGAASIALPMALLQSAGGGELSIALPQSAGEGSTASRLSTALLAAWRKAHARAAESCPWRCRRPTARPTASSPVPTWTPE